MGIPQQRADLKQFAAASYFLKVTDLFQKLQMGYGCFGIDV